MDDFRRRYDAPRRDYGLPARPPAPAQPVNPSNPPVPQPHHQTPHRQQPAHHPEHTSRPQASTDSFSSPDFLEQPIPRHTPAPQPAHHPAPAKPRAKLNSKPLKLVAAALVLIIAPLAVYHLSSAPKIKTVLPADLAKQANFSLYYPSPLPAGYVYEKTLGTYKNGQAYYMFSKGSRHIIVREQPVGSKPTDLSLLGGISRFSSPIGKAAIGTDTGQTAAIVATDTTLITINSNGYVPKDDITSAINNMEIINE